MTSTLLPSEVIKSLVQGVSTLSTSDSFVWLQDYVAQNAIFTEKVQDLEAANKVNIKAAADVQRELDKEVDLKNKIDAKFQNSENRAKSLQEDIDDLKKQLAKKQQELESTTEGFSRLQSELKRREVEVSNAEKRAEKESARANSASEAKAQVINELSETQKHLKIHLAELDQLKSYRFTQLEAPLGNITKLLMNIWKTAYNLVSSYCNVNLSDETFRNTGLWKTLQSRVMDARIPINASNSTAAKHMRVSAALYIMSHVLYEQIFQPNYVLKNSNELTNILDELLVDDFRREQHLRAELLALNVEQQKENVEARVENAVLDISSCCEVMVPKDRHTDFRAALEKFCKQLSSQWAQIQSLRQRVEPSFNEDHNEKWFLLSPAATESRNGHSSPQQGNGAQSMETVITTRQAGLTDMEEAVITDIKVVVWPCFLLSDVDGYQPITEGFVLNSSQLQEAADEESAFTTWGPARFVRHGSRKTRSNSIAPNSDGNQSKDNNSFLSGSQSGN